MNRMLPLVVKEEHKGMCVCVCVCVCVRVRACVGGCAHAHAPWKDT